MSLSALVGGTSGPDGIPSGRFRDLFNLGQPFAAQAFQGIQPAAQQLGGEFLDSSRGFLNQAATSANALSGLLGPGFAGAQLAGLSSLLNQNFSQNVLPQIMDRAVGAGQVGSQQQTRALLQGAEQYVNRPLFQGAGDILQSDLFNQRASAGMLGQIQNQAAGIGLPGASQAFNLGLAPFTAPFAPLQSMANLLGSMAPRPFDQSDGLIPAVSGLMTGAANVGGLFK